MDFVAKEDWGGRSGEGGLGGDTGKQRWEGGWGGKVRSGTGRKVFGMIGQMVPNKGGVLGRNSVKEHDSTGICVGGVRCKLRTRQAST